MPTIQPLNTYEQAEAWLLSMTDYERMLGRKPLAYNTRTFDLDRFRAVLSDLGDPQLRYAVIHVAGTKGKGSTCAFLESALRQCGFRTGLYTSPHLYRFTERIRINGDEITDAEFCRYLRELAPRVSTASQDNNDNPAGFRTVFEILTATAFQVFADRNVDIAIIETGLGGRLDSTNMFDRPGAGPLINVITSIGLDHTAILGGTFEAISREKAGIIRPHATTIIASQASTEVQRIVEDVVRSRCREIEASEPINVRSAWEFATLPDSRDCYRFRPKSNVINVLPGYDHLCPSLLGIHQASNVCTALTVLAVLKNLLNSAPGNDARITSSAIQQGLETASWPGRFQVLESDVPVIIDGAHCGLSSAALAMECQRRFGTQPAVIVTGFLRDKSGNEMLTTLFEKLPVDHAVAVAPPSPRAVPVDEISEALHLFLEPNRITTANDVISALDTAIRKAVDCRGYVILFGSLYLIGPALKAMKAREAAKNPD